MIDVVFIAWNRLEFTRFTFTCLLNNTNWSLVKRLIVYDDHSTDGTRQYLQNAIHEAPVATEFRDNRGSCVLAMHDHIQQGGAPLFATVENDLAVPSGWLDALNQVMTDHPDLELLGMESCWSGRPPENWDGRYSYVGFSHIGGSGLMRRSAFEKRKPFRTFGFTGFEIWQSEKKPRLGWITPDVQVCLLDRVPVDPWKSLSDEYIRGGWQRPWQPISEDQSWYYEWTLNGGS